MQAPTGLALRGASRDSLEAVRTRLDTLADTGREDMQSVGDQLLAVGDLLAATVSLRRALTDPSRPGEARAALSAAVLSEQVSPVVSDVVAGAVRERWSRPADLVDAIEVLGAQALAAGAERAGRLDSLEDQLFRFQRTVDATPALRAALTDAAAPAERRGALVEDLLRSQATPETVSLVRHAVVHPRGRGLDRILELYASVAAARRDRFLVLVVTAVPLTEQQQARLSAALSRQYGRQVHLNIDLDPEVVGGMRVEVGDEILDGTLARRIGMARRHLSG